MSHSGILPWKGVYYTTLLYRKYEEETLQNQGTDVSALSFSKIIAVHLAFFHYFDICIVF